MQKRICFFNSTKVWGGGEKWHFTNALELSKRGYEVSIYADHGGKLREKALENGLRVVPVSIGNLSFLNPFKISSLSRQLKKDGFDAIIMNLPADIKTAGISAKRAGIENIIYRRGMPHPIKNSAINRYIFGNVLDCVIANSLTIKESIRARNENLIDPSKIKVIYNGINVDAYDKMDGKPLYQRNGDDFILGNAGRLVDQKGQTFLIQMAQNLKEQGVNFKLLIAGTGPLETELKQSAKELGVEDQIVFLGFVKNIKAFMNSIDVFVFPSLFEGSANTILEAMFFNKPVITHDVSSMPEMVKDGENGYLVPAGDVAALSDRVIRLHENPGLISKMGQDNHQTILDHYQTKDKISELEDLL